MSILIAVEGGDASGKATQTKLLAERLRGTRSGYFNNTLGALRTMQLVDYPEAGHVVATDVWFQI